jgi:hypothetical protein
LAVLFTIQLVFPSALVRWSFIVLYLGLSVAVLAAGPAVGRRAFFALLLGRPLPQGVVRFAPPSS